jgi:hypothetical protein
MTVESATYISELVAANPAGGAAPSELDNHDRLIKAVLLASFPAVSGAVTSTHTELNYTDGVTSNIQTQLDAKVPKNYSSGSGNIGLSPASFQVYQNGGAGVTITLPGSGGVGDIVIIVNASGSACTIGRNGKTINGSAANVDVQGTNWAFFLYNGSTNWTAAYAATLV